MDKTIGLAGADDVSLVGGKAASLAKLIRGGFNVPEGFVIPVDSDPADAEILNKFDELCAEKVAVRSSAAAEDGARDAWAGQFDTFLNVGRDELIEAVKKCRNSASSDRAAAYAAEKNLKSGGVAVIVQKMVPADISGVAFSVHPVTKNINEIVIEAVAGLAERLVSGDVTPDNFVLEKTSLKLKDSFLTGEAALLSEDNLALLGETVKNIEKYYGRPMDVEWSLADDELYILQARPITTL